MCFKNFRQIDPVITEYTTIMILKPHKTYHQLFFHKSDEIHENQVV